MGDSDFHFPDMYTVLWTHPAGGDTLHRDANCVAMHPNPRPDNWRVGRKIAGGIRYGDLHHHRRRLCRNCSKIDIALADSGMHTVARHGPARAVHLRCVGLRHLERSEIAYQAQHDRIILVMAAVRRHATWVGWRTDTTELVDVSGRHPTAAGHPDVGGPWAVGTLWHNSVVAEDVANWIVRATAAIAELDDTISYEVAVSDVDGCHHQELVEGAVALEATYTDPEPFATLIVDSSRLLRSRR